MENNLINQELYDFLNRKFPKCANDLKEIIELLENVVQSTIDTIEDKSGEIIKKKEILVKQMNIEKKKVFLIS